MFDVHGSRRSRDILTGSSLIAVATYWPSHHRPTKRSLTTTEIRCVHSFARAAVLRDGASHAETRGRKTEIRSWTEGGLTWGTVGEGISVLEGDGIPSRWRLEGFKKARRARSQLRSLSSMHSVGNTTLRYWHRYTRLLCSFSRIGKVSF